MPTLLLYIFVAVIVIQFFYFLYFFRRFAYHKTSPKQEFSYPVSVIFFIKNQAGLLKKHLPLYLAQDYPDFEIVLINYDSYDESLDIIEGFEARDKRIKIVNVKNNEAFWGKKKYALTLGIKAASHEHLIFTEIECQPVSDNWIRELSSGFSEVRTIVIGYTAYEKIKKSFLNALVRFENLTTFSQRFSYQICNIPISGNGKNLAYHKKEFFRNNGFIDHINIRNGEDQLFINQAADKKNTSFVYSKESFTISEAVKLFDEWIDNKKAEYALIKKYKTTHKALIHIFYLSQLLLYTLIIPLLILKVNTPVVIGLFLLRWIVAYGIYIPITKKFGETSLLWLFPLYEIFLIFFQFLIFISNIISKPNNWR